MDGIARFARHVVSTRWDDLPAPAVAAVKTFVLDTLGVAIAGSGESTAARLADAAAGWGGGAEATVWGTGRRLAAVNAALVNGYQTHCLEFDYAVVNDRFEQALAELLAIVDGRAAALSAKRPDINALLRSLLS